MRIIYAILAAILLSFVAVQYNDPDPILWMPIYGYGAVLLAMAAGGKYHKVATIIGIVGYSAGAIYLFPSLLEWIEKEHGQNLMQRMANSKMYIEETRECGGLMIAAVFLLFSFLQHKTKTKTKAREIFRHHNEFNKSNIKILSSTCLKYKNPFLIQK